MGYSGLYSETLASFFLEIPRGLALYMYTINDTGDRLLERLIFSMMIQGKSQPKCVQYP